MRRPPTDLEILKEIHRAYASEYANYDEQKPTRSSKAFVPIDIDAIANRFGSDPDSIFARLLFDLDRRYGYKMDDDSVVHLFTTRLGSDENAINFPMLEAVLANLQQGRNRFIYPLTISITALVLAILGYFRDAF